MANEETNDARGIMAGDRGDAKAQSSGPMGDDPATAGPGEIELSAETAQSSAEQINPSAPGETGTTPCTNCRGMTHGHRGARLPHPAG